MQAVEVRGLSYQYRSDDPMRLKNISFRVSHGEFVAITGLSGCGKSTLCLCLSGIIPHCGDGVMTGEVAINGKDTKKFPLARLALEVGMVFQNPDTQLFSPMVEDEIAFAPENLCLPPERIRERVDDVISLIGIEALREANPCRLSGGEKHLVALAAVLALDPSVIILDEVMSQLDAQGRTRVAGTIKKLRSCGKTIIAVEHDLETVACADRLMVIDCGELVRFGPTRAIVTDRQFLKTSRLLFDDEECLGTE